MGLKKSMSMDWSKVGEIGGVKYGAANGCDEAEGLVVVHPTLVEGKDVGT
jgi:hypothetical protein